MPKVSVVIPNYNHERYLDARIRSVLAQTYRDFDVLILDDRSPDGSLQVIDGFRSDPRVRVIANEVNSGSTFRQWSKGLQHTTGEYVWIAESDDVADPRFLETLVPLLDAHANVGMAVCGSVAIDEAGVRQEEPLTSWVGRNGLDQRNVVATTSDFTMNGREYARDHLWVPWTTIPNASAILFRREALTENVRFGEAMKLCGDTMIYCRLLAKYDIARSAAPLNEFRQHRKNVRSGAAPWLWLREAIEIKRFLSRALGAPAWPSAIWRFFTYLSIFEQRAGASRKVPARRVPGVLRRALQTDAGLFLWTLRILFQESLASLAALIGFKTRATRPESV